MGFGSNGNGRGTARTNGNGRASREQLERLFGEQLGDIKAAETHASSLLSDMAIVAAEEEVASIFRGAASETEIQLARLDRLFDLGGFAIEWRNPHAEQGPLAAVLKEAQNDFDSDRDVDTTLIDAVRRSLRQQIAGYESACATARRLGNFVALDILLQSLDEELATDSALAQTLSRRTRTLRAI